METLIFRNWTFPYVHYAICKLPNASMMTLFHSFESIWHIGWKWTKVLRIFDSLEALVFIEGFHSFSHAIGTSICSLCLPLNDIPYGYMLKHWRSINGCPHLCQNSCGMMPWVEHTWCCGGFVEDFLLPLASNVHNHLDVVVVVTWNHWGELLGKEMSMMINAIIML